MKNAVTILCLALVISGDALASHNRAGEITFCYDGDAQHPYRYKIRYTSYTKTSSIAADRCYITMDFDDRTLEDVTRDNGPDGPLCELPALDGEVWPNDIKYNYYETIHDFPGVGQYFISVTDPNRIYNIVNISNSGDQVFYVESMLIIGTTFTNCSPQLLEPPIDFACTNKLFVHNPNAYDPDGDSLHFSLLPPKIGHNIDVGGYRNPNVAGGGNFTIDPNTGEITWDTPQQAGIYNIAILVEEWRWGYFIGYVIRDMQIIVEDCTNNPPVIQAMSDTCVVAGDEMIKTVTATDADGDSITLTATGGPFQVTSNPATFPQGIKGLAVVSGIFDWQTDCSHIRSQPYQVVFKAKDNGSPNLTDLETYVITVVAPPPKNLAATSVAGSLLLQWNKHSCPNTEGYKIYRKEGDCPPFTPACDNKIPGDYTLLGTNTGINDTTYVDDGAGDCLKIGTVYSYFVTSYYNSGTVESMASNIVCDTVSKDIPVHLKVSVDVTDATTGQMRLEWSTPLLQNPADSSKFGYKISRADDITGATFTLIATHTSFSDTTYDDASLNTVIRGYNYKVDLYDIATGNTVELCQRASSVYLQIIPGDQQLFLDWNEIVPWTNTLYEVYRADNFAGAYSLIATRTVSNYTDVGLTNYEDYCYKIKSIGTYGPTMPAVPDTLINWSEIVCSMPIDLTPPCPPVLSVKGCTASGCDEPVTFENYLNWTKPDSSCGGDIGSYQVHYSSSSAGPFQIIATLNGINSLSYTHGGLYYSQAGCYYITAVDTNGNVSAPGNTFCVDNCEEFLLPNVFTPNGDGINETFHPKCVRFVKSIRISIYDRWGVKMFEGTDPDINWDGKNRYGTPVADGVYYYVAEVEFLKLDTTVKKDFVGWVVVLTTSKF